MAWIPEEDFQRRRKKELTTRRWKEIREQVFQRYGRKCFVCGSTKRLQVHHLHYRNLGHERTEDLRPLCKKHHPKGKYTLKQIESDKTAQWYINLVDTLFRVAWVLVRASARIAAQLGKRLFWRD